MSGVRSALWITAEPPSTASGGGAIRQSHLLRRLAVRVPTDLVVAGVGTDERVRAVVRSCTEVPLPPTRPATGGASRRVGHLVHAADPRWSVEASDGREQVRALRAAIAGRDGHDVVVVEHTALHPLVRDRRPGERWLLTVHNVHSLTRDQEAARLTGRRAWLARREAAQSRRFERRAPLGYDAVITVSDEDAAALPYPTIVVPNGVDSSLLRPAPLPATPTVLFSGTFSYAPNVHGATWFCREIWPRVLDRRPDARLLLVGRDPAAEVRALPGLPGVRGAWDVPDVRPHLEAARVATVPLREGSGTRLKALEAMAAGRIVVGTTVGLGGLGVVDGRHALVRDDATSFAAAVVDALEPGGAAEQLTAPARALAETYDWDAVAGRFLAVVGL